MENNRLPFTNDKIVRKGCKDIFNAFMVKDAYFYGKYDIPFCPTIINKLPINLVAYDQINDSTDRNAYVHFYIDDQKFDGKNGIWNNPYKAFDKLKDFAGIITPDFSTNLDFPKALKIYNTYRMRAWGYWYGKNSGKQVINNVRLGNEDSDGFMLDGIAKNSVISIGTLGCIKLKQNKINVEKSLEKIVNKLSPKIILVYGNLPNKIFKKYIDAGILIVNFKSQTCIAFDARKKKICGN